MPKHTLVVELICNNVVLICDQCIDALSLDSPDHMIEWFAAQPCKGQPDGADSEFVKYIR